MAAAALRSSRVTSAKCDQSTASEQKRRDKAGYHWGDKGDDDGNDVMMMVLIMTMMQML